MTGYTFTTPVINSKGIRTEVNKGVASTYFEGGVLLEMVEIKGAQFKMGSSADEADIAFEDARRYNDDLTKERCG